MAYVVRKARRSFEKADGELNDSFEPVLLYFVVDNAAVSPGESAVAMCWSQSMAEFIRDALNA